ncbi:hypothetical protein [Pseudomonas sp. G(2018)]|uniref:hypothetical protein n=1 Tax=Pseudomonas sp. G(2018) TaxID=2502242 RepID=UPI0010F4327E|nr:hypothetical protein [Pseudomonas sp. G(2018)]
MRRRGAQFWLWLNKRLPVKTYEDVLNDGRQIEVQARITLEGMTQVFIGIYDASGGAMFEAFSDRGFREPLASALKWGARRARELVLETEPFVAPHRAQLTLSPLITDEAVLALRRMEMTDSERLKIKASDAQAEYHAAHSAMLELMRSTTSVDPLVWSEHRERLRQAIDRRVWVQRGYLLSTKSSRVEDNSPHEKGNH